MQKFSKMIQEFLKGFNRTILSSQTLYDFYSKNWGFFDAIKLKWDHKKETEVFAIKHDHCILGS